MNNYAQLKPTFDLTQSQLLLWMGQKLNPDAPLYNMVLIFELQGAIEIPHFQYAFQKLLQECDAMRTIFKVEQGTPKQQILPNFSYKLEVLDWSNDPETSTNFRSWAKARSQRTLDLSKCLFDSVLVKLSDEHFIWYFNQHHLITDAWAVSVQYQAVSDFYKHSLEGTLSNAPALPIFQNYVEYEKIARANPKKTKVREYWENQREALPTPPQLYGGTNWGATTRTDRILLDLGKERSDRLRTLTKEPDVRAWTQHLSLFNIFSTTLFAYLYRVSGQRKLSIGTPAHNRPTTDFKNTPGVFIEIFPMLAAIEEGDSFSTLLQRVRTEANGFLRNAQPGMSTPELNRKFNVVLNYIHAAFSDFNGIPMQSEWLHPDHCDPRHHLRLQVHDFDVSGSIQLYFDLNCEVFEEELRQTAPQHFLTLLDAFLEDRTQAIEQPNLLTAIEKQAVVYDFNHSALTNFEEKTVVELFQNQVQKTPNATAIVFKNETLTYRALDEKSTQLAHYLSGQGITSGKRVALYMKRSPELLISIWGVLKAGGTYLPIAADYPSERVNYMLEDAAVSLLLTNLISDFQVSAKLNLTVTEVQTALSSEPATKKNHLKTKGEDLAYLMYTSGSTGRPKGVMIAHHALSNYIQWARTKYISTERAAFPLFTMIGFDLTVTSLFLPLVSGGHLVIYEEKETGPDLALFDVIEENVVDVIKLTPSHLALLKERDLKDSRIQTMIVGGEDFKADLAKAIQNAFGENLRIFNEYGPTEATVGCILHQYNAKNNPQTSVPIGTPSANMQAYVLDAQLNAVPKGVTGELYLAGASLANGYWNQADRTAERFIENPFQAGTKMYETGDLARLNRDGNLEYLGRVDQQVKIGGIRIELGEIESAMIQHPNIQDCVVELRERHRHSEDDLHFCTECGLPSNYPNAEFDEKGICHLCRSFENYQQKAKRYFKTKADLKAIFDEVKKTKQGEYDCMMLLSGGKDSTYALGQLIEMGLKVLAFTLDNGYISEQAKDNIRRVATELGVDYIFGETPAMNEIFVDSLQRHCNVCNGCFKTIYTLSTKIALEKKIPVIVTGLSRGQFFETRLTEELFWSDEVDVAGIDNTILNARKAYHRMDDAVNRLLDVSMFEGDEVFEKVQFLDFYRYTDVSLDEMLAYLDKRLTWSRPTDTGRSTNCLINQVGIYVHKKEQGYNNYAFPYSWDVRMGHKNRGAALEEINEEVNETEVKKIMAEIGYHDSDHHTAEHQLVAYYISSDPIPTANLRAHLAPNLPAYMIPTHFKRLDALPLTPNGKVDRKALPDLQDSRPDAGRNYVAASNEFEEMLVEIWEEVLQISKIGVQDNFLELGGNSLGAIRLTARINEAFELDLPLTQVFEFPTIAGLAAHIEEVIMEMLEE